MAASLVSLLHLGVDPITMDHPAYGTGDIVHYVGMATGESDEGYAPFRYRILLPALVRVSPLSTEAAFQLHTALFLIGTGLLLHRALRGLGASPWYASLGVILFYGLGWAAKFSLAFFWQTEPGLFFFGVAAFLALIEGRDWTFAILLVLATLSREAALFLVALYYGYHARSLIDPRIALRSFLVGAPALAVHLVLRWALPVVNRYDPLHYFQEYGYDRLTGGIVGSLWGWTTGTWGVPVLLFALVGLYHEPRLRRAAFFFLPLVMIQPLFASNFDRLVVFGFVLMVPLAVSGLRYTATRFGFSPWMTVGYALIPLVGILLKEGYIPPSREQQFIALVVWTLVVLAGLRIQKGKAARA